MALGLTGAAAAADLVFDGGGTRDGAVLVFEGGGEVMLVETTQLAEIDRRQRDDGMNEVTFRMSEEDGTRFLDLTTRLEGEFLRISFCGTVLAEPMVLMPIEGGHVLITGGTDAGTEALFDALEAQAPCPEPGGS